MRRDFGEWNEWRRVDRLNDTCNFPPSYPLPMSGPQRVCPDSHAAGRLLHRTLALRICKGGVIHRWVPIIRLGPTADEYYMRLTDCQAKSTTWNGLASMARCDGRLLVVHQYPVPHAFSIPKSTCSVIVASVAKYFHSNPQKTRILLWSNTHTRRPCRLTSDQIVPGCIFC